MWNEADEIDRLVDALGPEGRRLVEAGVLTDFEVVLVDDGSDDGTRPRAEALAAAHPWVVVTGHEDNRGLGAAIRTGIAAARMDLLLYTDADLPVDPTEIERAVELVPSEGPFLVSARRRSRRPDGLGRYLKSITWNRLVRSSLDLEVDDVNFAFKLLPTALARDLELTSEGSFIDAEMVARAARRGVPIVQFDVEYQARRAGRSSFSSVAAVLAILREWRTQRRSLA